MAVVSGDIKYYLSGGATGAGNSNPAVSLGGVITTTLVGTNIFDNVTSGEATAGDVEYRCIFVKNTNATGTLYSAKAWIVTNTPSGDTEVKIALAGEGVSATTEIVAGEGSAPSGESFAVCANEGAGLSLGNLVAGAYYGVWIQRTVTLGASAYSNDGFTLRVKGDTSA